MSRLEEILTFFQSTWLFSRLEENLAFFKVRGLDLSLQKEVWRFVTGLPRALSPVSQLSLAPANSEMLVLRSLCAEAVPSHISST